LDYRQRITHLMTPSVDPFDVVDFVRGTCCSFSTTSSICLFNSANLGSRSSRGLPQPKILALRVTGSGV
jgi:hypothetical protein